MEGNSPFLARTKYRDYSLSKKVNRKPQFTVRLPELSINDELAIRQKPIDEKGWDDGKLAD